MTVDTSGSLGRDASFQPALAAVQTAMADAPFPSAPVMTGYAANAATYRGEAAFSVSLTHYMNTEAPGRFSAVVRICPQDSFASSQRRCDEAAPD